MYTVCTHCHTRFRVSAKHLKAAGGQVRCGKCHEVFDAYHALDDAANPSTVPTVTPDAAETPGVSIKVGAGTTVDLRVALAAESKPEADAQSKGEPPSISASAPEVPPIEDLFAGLPDGRLPNGQKQKPLPPPLSVSSATLDLPEPPLKPPHEMPFVPAEDLPAPQPKRSGHAAAWWSGSVLLTLLLLVQLVNAEREALGQNLVLGPSLRAVYAVLGDPLPPTQSVTEWQVSGVNVTTDPDQPGALSMTGTLTNQASYEQPWPVLRVVLEDGYGQTLRARDFKPAEYLPGTQANMRLAVGQAARFRLDVVDPGADAVGFTLTPCLDTSAGRICSTPEHD